MAPLLGDLFAFGVALFRHWLLVVAALGMPLIVKLLETWRGKPFSWPFLRRWLVVAPLFVAVFLAWRDQAHQAQGLLRANTRLEAHNQEQQQRLDALPSQQTRDLSLEKEHAAFAQENATLRRQLDQRDRRHTIREALSRLYGEGEELKRACRTHPKVPGLMAQANEWARRATLYLAHSGLDHSYEARFTYPQPLAMSPADIQSEERANLWKAINVRTQALAKFLEELKE